MRRTALLMMLLAILFGNRLTVAQDQAVCLQYDDSYAGRGVINMTTGEKTGGEVGTAIQSVTDILRESPPVMVSPDQHYAALQFKTLEGNTVFALYPAYNPDATLNLDNDANDGLKHYDIKWSPDSQWLSFLTFRPDDGYYLSLMNTDGHITQTQLISTRFEDSVASFGWSGDGRYLAVTVADSGSGPLRKIEIWSIPDLEMARLIKPTFSRIGPRQFIGESGIPEELLYPNRIQWSSQGSVLAYLDYTDDGMNDNRSTLNLYTPDDDKTTTYDLADNRYESGLGMAWSPDGQSVAVASTQYDDSKIGRIETVSVSDDTLHTVSEKAMHYLLFSDGGSGFPFMRWSADGHALFFVDQPPTQSHTLGTLKAYLPASGETVTLAPHIYMNPHMDTSRRFLTALSPDDGIDHNGYLNHDAVKQTPEMEDSIMVVDTSTLEVKSVPALQNLPYLFQAYGRYFDATGWLLLAEDELITWGINMRTGQQTALYPPHVLYNYHGKQFYYYPVKDADVVAGFQLDGGKAPSVTISSLQDGSSKIITYPFMWPIYAVALSPDKKLLAVYMQNDFATFFRTLYIIQADGTLLWQFDNIDFWAHNFRFVTCT